MTRVASANANTGLLPTGVTAEMVSPETSTSVAEPCPEGALEVKTAIRNVWGSGVTVGIGLATGRNVSPHPHNIKSSAPVAAILARLENFIHSPERRNKRLAISDRPQTESGPAYYLWLIAYRLLPIAIFLSLIVNRR